MELNELMPNEQIITYAPGHLVVVTTHRIRYDYKEWGRSTLISVMLEKISSIKLNYISFPQLLVIGSAIAVIGGVMLFSPDARGPGACLLVVGLIVVSAFFSTRRHICQITADDGTNIIFRTENIARETLLVFVGKLETAKNHRLRGLAICDDRLPPIPSTP